MNGNEDRTQILGNLRSQIFTYITDAENEGTEIPKDIQMILMGLTSLLEILDNHEARLILAERCFNQVKQTYQAYDLNH